MITKLPLLPRLAGQFVLICFYSPGVTNVSRSKSN